MSIRFRKFRWDEQIITGIGKPKNVGLLLRVSTHLNNLNTYS